MRVGLAQSRSAAPFGPYSASPRRSAHSSASLYRNAQKRDVLCRPRSIALRRALRALLGFASPERSFGDEMAGVDGPAHFDGIPHFEELRASALRVCA